MEKLQAAIAQKKLMEKLSAEKEERQAFHDYLDS